mgnify:CR=1 FL=1
MENDLIVPFSSNHRKIDFQWSWEKGSYSVIRVVEIMKVTFHDFVKKIKNIFLNKSRTSRHLTLFIWPRALPQINMKSGKWEGLSRVGPLKSKEDIYREQPNEISLFCFILAMFQNRDHLIFFWVQNSTGIIADWFCQHKSFRK